MRKLIIAMVAAVAVTAGCGTAAAATAAPSPPTAGSALAALAQLPVKGRAPKTGYTRAQFGTGWKDPDGNGCDARRDVLARQAVGTPVRAGAHNCVLTATILDPYTDKQIPSSGADVDHVVALGDAWQKGAQQIGAAQREALANDPLNLLAVTASVNRSKGDADSATWLPPVKAYRCPYVARQVAVKVKYRLWVTTAEHDAIAGVLAGCLGQELPR